MFEDYNGDDNDEFIKEMIEDFATKEKPTLANPTGVVLTKFNAKRATERFVTSALKLSGKKLDQWMAENYKASWEKYDVNKAGKIDERMLPQYFKSLVGDNTIQFGLREQDHFENKMRTETGRT